MGAWNTKIDGNDIYLDVKCYLNEKMKQVNNLDLAIAKTIMEFVGISEAYDIQMFIALSDAIIEIGKPYKTIIKKAISFIENGKDDTCYIDSVSRKQETLEWVSRVKKYLN
jgi:small nuclear ribonucleoprotein (snRNP)-like protein